MLGSAVTLGGQTPAPPSATTSVVFIKAGRLVDGRANTVQTSVGILIEGQRIRAVGPVAQIETQGHPHAPSSER